MKGIQWLVCSGVLLSGWCGSEASGGGPDETAIREAVSRLGDTDFSVRQAAYDRLLAAGAESPEQVLACLPDGSPDPDIRAGIEGLRREIPVERLRRRILLLLDGQTGKAELARELAEHPSFMVLNNFATTAAVDPAPKIAVLDFILREAGPDFRPMAWGAMQNLARIVPEGLKPEIVRVILERLPPRDEESLRVQAVEILGDVTEKERAAARLSPFLETGDPARHTAASALIRHLRAESRPLVERLILKDPDIDGRAMLLWNWCVAVGGESRTTYLGLFLADPDPAVRMVGIGCFKAHGRPEDAGLLKPILEGSDELKGEAEEAREHVLNPEKNEDE